MINYREDLIEWNGDQIPLQEFRLFVAENFPGLLPRYLTRTSMVNGKLKPYYDWKTITAIKSLINFFYLCRNKKGE